MVAMKETGLAVIVYQGDHDDLLPPSFIQDPTIQYPFQFASGRRIGTWLTATMPYMKNWQILASPKYEDHSIPNPLKISPFIAFGIPPRSELYGSPYWSDSYYGFGTSSRFAGLLGGSSENAWTPNIQSNLPSKSSGEVGDPSMQSLLVESTAPDWWLAKYGRAPVRNDTFNYYTIWAPYGRQTNQTFGPYFRWDMRVKRAAPQLYLSLRDSARRTLDMGKAPVVFLDGHAKWIDSMAYFRPTQGTGYMYYPFLKPE